MKWTQMNLTETGRANTDFQVDTCYNSCLQDEDISANNLLKNWSIF